jgi:hypothetical protein
LAISGPRLRARLRGLRRVKSADLGDHLLSRDRLSQLEVGIEPAPARGVVRCDGKQIIFGSGRMLDDFIVGVAHFSMCKMRAILHCVRPRQQMELRQQVGIAAEAIFWMREQKVPLGERVPPGKWLEFAA